MITISLYYFYGFMFVLFALIVGMIVKKKKGIIKNLLIGMFLLSFVATSILHVFVLKIGNGYYVTYKQDGTVKEVRSIEKEDAFVLFFDEVFPHVKETNQKEQKMKIDSVTKDGKERHFLVEATVVSEHTKGDFLRKINRTNKEYAQQSLHGTSIQEVIEQVVKENDETMPTSEIIKQAEKKYNEEYLYHVKLYI